MPRLAVAVSVAAIVAGHHCIHDEVADAVSESAWSQSYGLQSIDLDASASVTARSIRHLETSTSTTSGSPLRVVPYFDNVTLGALLADKRSLVIDYLVPAAVSFWSQALRVIPVQGSLFAAPPCTSAWNTVPSTCANLAPSSYCFEMPYPPEHYSPLRVCSTCLSAGCATGNCTVVRPNNTGIPNADMVMYIRATTTSRCTDNTLAYAITCQRDQFDRPTFGMINFCPDYLDTSTLEGPSYDIQVTTALHEFAHALGFSSASFPLMRNRDGTPRTTRQGGSRTGRAVASTGTCANGTSITSTGLPSNATVVYQNVRGHAVTYMATPTVVAFATSHFNCSSVVGAEIENNDGSCMGSHW
ncbi:hypothetical protein DYB28_000956 [Aphanomyces astaci]|uniref:Leishmanolysin-like peptidase n=1 Tax=Aphanomyces astaci TaxID=112090 RepID=A0A397FDD7_APHAT|nr:hypothetical protein DYB30_005318 [Aphanomyces astaci]RHY79947.1 hypothetical protein DYB26_004710 [Aphanomyces astaci]RHZ28155.1 hypothetical protein DYB31_002267 [Aphanomyces astaci]RLO06779.1 hypothetical protein DYB28_000956 [Aphanomyces astaci]